MKRVLLIVNPVARRADSSVRAAVRALAKLGVTCDVVMTEQRGHAAEIACSRVAGHDAIFALGGDGTAIEVIGALAPHGPPIGILPGGTGNLLARALGISLNVARAARSLALGDEARVDLGHLSNGSSFAIGAGVGIDAAMIAGTSARWKRRAGVLAYIFAGAFHVLNRRRFTASVVVDGEHVVREASVVLVSNFGVLMNGLVTLGPGIRCDDGLLDVCIFDPLNVADVIRITRKLVFRDFTPDAAMTYLKGSHISVSTEPALPAQADGELIGRTPFVATVEPLAARLLVPHCQINRQ